MVDCSSFDTSLQGDFKQEQHSEQHLFQRHLRGVTELQVFVFQWASG